MLSLRKVLPVTVSGHTVPLKGYSESRPLFAGVPSAIPSMIEEIRGKLHLELTSPALRPGVEEAER